MKTNLERNKELFNNIARVYDSSIFSGFLIRPMKKMLSILNLKPGYVILDSGCGTGIFLDILKNKGIKSLYGIDISEQMLKIAKKRLGPKVRLEQVPAESQYFKGESFDYIFSTEAFHHYYNIDKCMQNFYNSLKKSGTLAVLDLDFGILNPIFHLLEPGNNQMHSRKQFKSLFQKHGFKNIIQKRISIFFILTLGKKP